MKLPSFLRRLGAEPAAPSMASAGRTLAQHRHNQDRNKIIDRANELAAMQGKPALPRRPE